LTGAVVDLARVRTFLRRWCDTEVALDRLEVSHLTVGPDGLQRVLYEGPGPGGQVLRLVGQRVAPAEGRRLEAELNRDYRRPRAPAAPGFVQPAIYAPELELLFQVFPADRRLGVAESERTVRREAGGQAGRIHRVDGPEQSPRRGVGRILSEGRHRLVSHL